MTIEEIWKDIDGFENYQVSNLGRVKSIGNSFSRKEKILKDRIYKPGYNTVILYKNKKLIHLGYFKNEIDAHNAYQNKLKQIL